MNILLISVQKNLDALGAKSLHYLLLQNGYNSSLLFVPELIPGDTKLLETITQFVMEKKPGLIGMSMMSLEYESARSITQHLKQNSCSIPIVWGGIHPTISPGKSLENADYVCIGEGENTILDMARAVKNGESFEKINNLCYRGNGGLVQNRLYPHIEDLDDLPPYDHIPVHSYVLDNRQIQPIDLKLFRNHARYRGSTYSIITSRGCPFSCTFCCNNHFTHLYKEKKIRRRSQENIINELEKGLQDYPEMEYINFLDDCFIACSASYLKKFCELYTEKINVPFIVRAIPIFITREKVELLKYAGLAWISLGLQSGSDRVCKEVYHRKSYQKDFSQAANIVHETGVAAFYDVILDNPFEHDEDTFETIQTFMNTPKPYFTQIFSLSLFEGTDIYERAKKECPELMEDYREKDFDIVDKKPINDIVRLSAFMHKKWVNRILGMYKVNPGGVFLKLLILMSKILSITVLEPITYFRVIKLSQGGSWWRTLKVVPNYFKNGFKAYLAQFKKRQNRILSETEN